MSFKIKEKSTDGITYTILTNEKTGDTVEIVPQFGAMVHQITFKRKKKLIPLLAVDKSSDEIKQNPLYRGRQLFPFNDAIPDGTYRFNEKIHSLDCNISEPPLAIHGFIYKCTPEIVSKKENSNDCAISYKFSLKPDQYKGYPFAVDLTLTYTLKNRKLITSYTIKNTHDDSIPCALGWHPYFCNAHGNLNGVMLKMDSEYYIDLSSGKPKASPCCEDNIMNYSDFKPLKGGTLDHAFRVPANGTVTLKTPDATVCITQNQDLFKYVQLYIPEDGNSIAIEPISAPADSFNNHKTGLITLKKGESISGDVVISI